MNTNQIKSMRNYPRNNQTVLKTAQDIKKRQRPFEGLMTKMNYLEDPDRFKNKFRVNGSLKSRLPQIHSAVNKNSRNGAPGHGGTNLGKLAFNSMKERESTVNSIDLF